MADKGTTKYIEYHCFSAYKQNISWHALCEHSLIVKSAYGENQAVIQDIHVFIDSVENKLRILMKT